MEVFQKWNHENIGWRYTPKTIVYVDEYDRSIFVPCEDEIKINVVVEYLRQDLNLEIFGKSVKEGIDLMDGLLDGKVSQPSENTSDVLYK